LYIADAPTERRNGMLIAGSAPQPIKYPHPNGANSFRHHKAKRPISYRDWALGLGK
jgi:hypothetical protein